MRGVDGRARARRAADALRQRAARQEADRQPAVGARGAAHQGRRLQRAHGALCRDGARRSASRRASPSASSTSHGAFYYHAWPEVYIDEGRGRGLWLPVDPTFNQFPADATHLRLARGGLDKQAAILPLIGRLKMTILDLELAPERDADPRRPASRSTPARWRSPCPPRRRDGCWSQPRVGGTMIAIHDLVKQYGTFTAVDGVTLDVQPGEIHGFLGPNGAGKTTTHPDDCRAAEADLRTHPRQRPRSRARSPRRRRRRSASSPIGRSSTRS